MTTRPPAQPWADTIDEVVRTSQVDPALGLTSSEAEARLRDFGDNQIPEAPPEPLWRRVLAQFVDPLVLLLLAAIVISTLAWMSEGANGFPIEATVIATIVILNAAIGTWQEGRALKAVAGLRRLTALRSNVLRDGRIQSIDTAGVVPGDVILLAQGDAVGADCRLVETASMTVAEAPLTGESTPVTKTTAVVPDDTATADRHNMAFQGTAVTQGRGVGIVTATGMATEIGRIARLLDEADDEPTPLERQIEWLGKMLGIVVVVLATIVVVTIIATSDIDDLTGVLDAGVVGVSLAVAAVPEGLPAILTIVLAVGVQRMAADQAIVKQLASVETLGSATVICTDKTGTLTRNEMSVVAVVTPSGRASISGGGYRPIGDVYSEAGPITDAVWRAEIDDSLRAASIVNDATLEHGDDGRWEASGEPTELALIVAAEKLGARCRSQRIDEIPFDSARKLMSTLDVDLDGCFELVDGPVLFTKGAPDVLLERCDRERVRGQVRTLTSDGRAEWSAVVEELANEALRTIAVAYRPGEAGEAPELAEEHLVLLGVFGIIDPPRPEAQQAIADARRGGVRVVMMTGDHPQTAARIATVLGVTNAEVTTTGRELAELDDEALDRTTEETGVYARVDPEHKLRLVESLQRSGHVTAMTGDGVNDGPALKQADIGIAMGRTGTDVAKEASDMVLADDNFATIVRAIREGREIYADIRKFLRYLLGSNTGEVLVVFLGVVFAARIGLHGDVNGLAVPLLATQILWINLVTDGLLALALGVDPSVEDVLARPPRRPDERVVDGEMLRTIVTVGVATALASLVALDLELEGGLLGGSGDVETARTMAFTTLVLAQIGNAFTARSDRVSAFVEPFANRLLWLAAAATVAAQVLVVHLPGLNDAFDATPLTLERWLICAGLAISVLLVAEVVKLVVRSSSGDVAVSDHSALASTPSPPDDGRAEIVSEEVSRWRVNAG